jgi:hypothetical protein
MPGIQLLTGHGSMHLQHICTELLSGQDVEAARLACRKWARGIPVHLTLRRASIILAGRRGLATRALAPAAGAELPAPAPPGLHTLDIRLPVELAPAQHEVHVLCSRLCCAPALASVSVHLDCNGAFVNLQHHNTAQVGSARLLPDPPPLFS